MGKMEKRKITKWYIRKNHENWLDFFINFKLASAVKQITQQLNNCFKLFTISGLPAVLAILQIEQMATLEYN